MSLLGVDIGTSAIKVVAYEAETGAELSSARTEHASANPGPGLMELDPELVWTGFVDAVRFVNAAEAVQRDPVTAFALSVSCDEVIPVDDTTRPLGPCIMAPDARGADVVPEIGSRISGAELYRRSGLGSRPMYPLARILWYRKHQPDVARAASRYLGWGEFFLTRLGLPAVTDETTAGRWLAYDVVAHDWMYDLVDALQLPAALFPDVASPGDVIGTLPPDASARLGFRAPPVVVAGAFDQICAAVGAGLHAPGEVVVGSGTWENTTIVADGPLGPVGLETGATWGPYVSPGRYAVLVMNPGGGSILRWFRNRISGAGVQDTETLDQTVDLFARGADERPSQLLYLPQLRGYQTGGGGSHPTGALVGLTVATSRDDVVRALLEGITFELRLNLEGVGPEVTIRPPLRNTGGGARSTSWVQLKADVLGMALSTVEASEPGCLGAAILAGVGAGMFSEVATAQAQVCRIATQVDPDPERHRFYTDHLALYRDLYPALRDVLTST